MKIRVLLALILVLGAILRFFWLDKYPAGVTGDEIQQGYTAYSLLHTGKDEWGDLLPLNPRGFGDYKPPLFSYILVPSVAIFGLNEFAIRFPAALAGVLSIFVIYLLGKKLFESELIGILAALLLAIAPWAVQFNRVAWESNIGMLFFLTGAYFFIKSFESQKALIYSMIAFGLSTLSYHSFKLFSVLFILSLAIIYRKTFLKFDRRILFASAGVLVLFFSIIVYGYIFSGAGRRAADAAIYNPENIVALRNTQIEDKLPQPWGRVVNNKAAYLGSQFVENYLGYFSTTFLYSPNRSDGSIFNVPGKGLFYVWEALLIIYAIYLLIREKQKFLPVIIFWVILAPIPAALTRNYMYAARVETLLPMLTVLGAFALGNFLQKVKRYKFRNIVFGSLILIIGWSLVTRVDYYLYHTFNNDLGGLQYGYKEIVGFTEANKDKYDKIIFTKGHSEPQAFVAFYSKMDPQVYQQNSQNWKYFETDGFKFLDIINYKLEKYEFKNMDWKTDSLNPNTLIVLSKSEMPEGVSSIKTVKDNKGEIAFAVFDTNLLNKKQ